MYSMLGHVTGGHDNLVLVLAAGYRLRPKASVAYKTPMINTAPGTANPGLRPPHPGPDPYSHGQPVDRPTQAPTTQYTQSPGPLGVLEPCSN